MKFCTRLLNLILLLVLTAWFLLESSEVFSVIKDSSGYPFGYEGSGWRYQSMEVYLISSIVSSIISLTGIIVSFFMHEKKKLYIRLVLSFFIFLIVLEFRLSII